MRFHSESNLLTLQASVIFPITVAVYNKSVSIICLFATVWLYATSDVFLEWLVTSFVATWLADRRQWSTIAAAHGGHFGLMSRTGSGFSSNGHRLAGTDQSILWALVDVIIVVIVIARWHSAVRTECAAIVVSVLHPEAEAKRKSTWRRKHVESLLMLLLLLLVLGLEWLFLQFWITLTAVGHSRNYRTVCCGVR